MQRAPGPLHIIFPAGAAAAAARQDVLVLGVPAAPVAGRSKRGQ